MNILSLINKNNKFFFLHKIILKDKQIIPYHFKNYSQLTEKTELSNLIENNLNTQNRIKNLKTLFMKEIEEKNEFPQINKNDISDQTESSEQETDKSSLSYSSTTSDSTESDELGKSEATESDKGSSSTSETDSSESELSSNSQSDDNNNLGIRESD